MSDVKPHRSQALELDNAFWRFALRVYGEAGIPECCLTLQNQFEINVNLLLFSAWAGATGKVLDASMLAERAALIETWTVEVVEPLRRARTAWKTLAAASPGDYPGREDLKVLELRSEQIVCALLYRSVVDETETASDPAGAHLISANVALVLDRAGIPDLLRDSSIDRVTRASLVAIAQV